MSAAPQMNMVDMYYSLIEESATRRAELEIKQKGERRKIGLSAMTMTIVKVGPEGMPMPAEPGSNVIPILNPLVEALSVRTEGLGFQGDERKPIPRKDFLKYQRLVGLYDVILSHTPPERIPVLSRVLSTTNAFLEIMSHTRDSSGSLELLRARGSQLPTPQQEGQAQPSESNVRF